MVSASQAPNPRASSSVSSVRTDVRDSKRSTASATAAGARSATARRNARVTNRSATNQNVSNARSAARQVVTNPNRGMGTSGIITIRSASPAIARSATMTGANVARSGTNIANAGVGRMATARATAVFSDVSKIGGGMPNVAIRMQHVWTNSVPMQMIHIADAFAVRVSKNSAIQRRHWTKQKHYCNALKILI